MRSRATCATIASIWRETGRVFVATSGATSIDLGRSGLDRNGPRRGRRDRLLRAMSTPPAGKSLRDLAGALDERLHHGTKGSIFQRHDPHGILVDGQFDWERFERISFAVRPDDGAGQ